MTPEQAAILTLLSQVEEMQARIAELAARASGMAARIDRLELEARKMRRQGSP